MWNSAGKRHKHRQELCKRLQLNYSHCEECNRHVVLMVRIGNESEGGMYATQPVTWAKGSVSYSVRGYEIPSAPSDPTGTLRCF
jgi:hypothetical protein